MKSFPGWRDATAYPTSSAFKESAKLADDPLYTSKAWAWQFLRRNLKYQDDYRELKKNGGYRKNHIHAEKYGLCFMVPYLDEEPIVIPFQNSYSLYSLNHRLNRIKPVSLADYQLALVFDLRLPLREQLNQAKRQFEEAFNRSKYRDITPKRKRTEAFIRYLRIIDAKQIEKTSNKVIAAEFLRQGIYSPEKEFKYYPGQSSIERDWKVARTLLNDGYRLLAYS